MPQIRTSEQILQTARALLASGGIGAVSFDAIARQLGRSKQAVLYWYPSKQDLLAAMFLPWLEAEADAAADSVACAAGRGEAIRAFVRAVAQFHAGDLDRFRMMYLVPQTLKPGAQGLGHAALAGRVHPVTGRIYSALAARLDGTGEAARREAAAIHAAVLGLVLMFSLADRLNDPLKHTGAGLIEALAACLSGGSGCAAADARQQTV